jgi:zinc transport system permease protein
LFSYLFGSILSVTKEDVYLIVGFGALAMFLLGYFHRELYFIAFDEEVAQVSGIAVKKLNFMMVSIVAVIIALSIQIVGTLLIGALMVMPTVAALRFRQGFAKTVILAVIFALLSVFLGMILSFYLSLPSGATIVLCILAIFIISLVVNRK